MEALIIVSIFCFLTGILSITAGIRKKKVCTELVVGTIIDICVSHGNGLQSNVYSPIYSFNVNGKEYKGTIGQVSMDKTEFKIGTEHKIKYNPNNPKQFIDAERDVLKVYGIVFLIAGIVFLALIMGIK